MNALIKAKVARVLNSREIVITAGSIRGVKLSMLFDVLFPKGENITDPDTGEILGAVNRPKVRVKITQVQEKLSVASTYKKKEINVGGTGGLPLVREFGVLSKALMPPSYITKYETLKTDEKTWEDLDEDKSYVKTGDPVIQVLKEQEELTE